MLKESEDRFLRTIDTARDAIISLDADEGVITGWNCAAEAMFGYSREEIIGQQLHETLAPPRFREASRKGVAHFVTTGEGEAIGTTRELVALHKSGTEFPIELSLSAMRVNGKWQATGIARDITQRKQAEQALRNSTLFARSLIEASRDPLTAIGRDGKIIDVNEAAVRMTGVPREGLIGSDYSIYVSEPEKARAGMQEVYVKGFVIDFPAAVLHTSGKVTDVLFNTSFIRDASGEVAGALAIARDITERKQSEQARTFDAAVISSIQQASPDGILLVNPQGQIISYNQRFLEMWAIPPEIAGNEIDAPVLEFVATQVADPGTFLARVNEIYANAGVPSHDDVYLKDGRILDRISTPVSLKNGTYLGRVWYFRDITEPKRTEITLQRLNRTLKTLSAANAAVVRATNEEELLNEMCRVVVQTGGYRLVWIGFTEHDEAKTVCPVAWAGEHPEYIQTALISWAETERGRGPTGTAIRSGEAQINQDVETNPVMAPWRVEMLKCGFKSSAALPLKNKSEVSGSLTLYSGEAEAFGPEEIDLLKELAADLSFGIYARRGQAGREAALSALQETLKSTVQAIATSVEMRDAYTAGHQRRVAELAAAIAREIGLTELQIDGLFLAATIHDVGKINIPAELLSKPGKLTPLEFQMIQTHAQTGYDIIKGINFPWPIGQMVLQHHERLDGSGYPNHLKGEAILIEAKVLAVADVVDAMLAHRPYRPALGLDAALDEIEAGKGRLYDPAIADACIALFRQKGFEFH